jgi:hypothetical protein
MTKKTTLPKLTDAQERAIRYVVTQLMKREAIMTDDFSPHDYWNRRQDFTNATWAALFKKGYIEAALDTTILPREEFKSTAGRYGYSRDQKYRNQFTALNNNFRFTLAAHRFVCEIKREIEERNVENAIARSREDAERNAFMQRLHNRLANQGIDTSKLGAIETRAYGRDEITIQVIQLDLTLTAINRTFAPGGYRYIVNVNVDVLETAVDTQRLLDELPVAQQIADLLNDLLAVE